MTDLCYGRDTRTSLLVPGLSLISRILALVGDVIEDIRWTFVTGLKLQAQYQQLAAMSDTDLAKLGLSRTDIPAAVVAPLKLL
jgi:hypothetical protein